MRLKPGAQSVITGAGSGLGRALALSLARRGGRLTITDVNLDGAEETASLVRAAGAAEATVHRCDVTRPEEVAALSDAIRGPIDLVVNNAGVTSAGRIGELSLEAWRWTIEVDLFGVIHGCHTFVPRLRAQGHGHVLNVASAAGLVYAPEMAAYCAAKAGVVAISESLAAELIGSGVGVTVLCPTFLKTDLLKTGQFASTDSRRTAEKLMSRGKDADFVAEAALRSVEAGELHSIPMADGRLFWRLRRLAPRTFVNLAARFARLVSQP